MSTAQHCFHCGDVIIGKPVIHSEQSFCCTGCRSVFQLLTDSELGQFYTYEKGAGVKPETQREQQFAFLDLPEIRKRYVRFEEGDSCQVVLFLPGIHCSSCIYLLEHLSRLDKRIQSCQVHFTKREATISFTPSAMQLSELAALLAHIGYAPNFGERKKQETQSTKQYFYKLGIAAFAFGSIMLWSFPEYVGIATDNPEFRNFTSYLSLLVSIPVFVYSANEYLLSAWKAIRYRMLNLDVPISIGIVALYAQSCYSILSGAGPGYMDSFAGFIFFLLIGKWFQGKTYRSLSFDRDYTSYFPVAATRMTEGTEELVPIEQLVPGDHILVRNEEVIPCDAILLSETATIDYRFVSGESRLVKKHRGDFIYAGAKLCDSLSEFKVEHESNRSHLTQLWNQSSEPSSKNQVDRLSVYFLSALLIIAGIAGISWLVIDATRATENVVAVLIVACPCALALSRPFTYGNIMRLLGRKGLYLKNSSVIEGLTGIDTIIFDKTGTLTTVQGKVSFEGHVLSVEEIALIFTAVQSSVHPYSREITRYLFENHPISEPCSYATFIEESGKGISLSGNFGNLRIGSATFTKTQSQDARTSVHVRLNERYLGRFVFQSAVRPHMDVMLRQLDAFKLHVLSGDNSGDQELMHALFPEGSKLVFQQTPQSKQHYIRQLQQKGHTVLMIGDGLNDGGALKTADVGISISDNVFHFTPSSDAIIDARTLHLLPNLLAISRFSRVILNTCFTFSVLYNLVGLSFAVTGQLSPIVAAILMPVSSITVVIIATFGTLVFSPKTK